MLHEVHVACSVQMGASWQARAPVRRALIPAKRSNISDRHDTLCSDAGPGKSSSNDVDRVHNALLEELCADFGVTDSSYVDFLNFDVPASRVQSGQLPADLEELGEIVTFGTARPKTESVISASEGVHRSGSSSSHVSFLRPSVTTAKPASGMQMKIPDDVASPTISSSCEESKPLEGGGEGLSDLPPTVHSTTGSASAKLDTNAYDSSEDDSKHTSVKMEPIVETKRNHVMPPSTQVPDEHESSAVSPSKDQPERNDSTASSPRHVAKKARVIASGGDLLEDVKKSYAFVCGADMFSQPTRPAMSHPRLHTPVGFQHRMNNPASYFQNATGYGVRMPFTDGYDSQFQYGMQNRSYSRQPASDNSCRTISGFSQSAHFDNLTPGKGFRQRYSNEWQTSPASAFDRPYHANVVHPTNTAGTGTVNFRLHDAQYTQRSTDTGSDINSAVAYSENVQCPRTDEFPGQVDRNRFNYQTMNHSRRSAVNQSGRSYGYSAVPYGGSYQHVGRQPGPQQNEFYHNPPPSPYRNPPSHATDAVRHGTITTNDGRNTYLTGCEYPKQYTHPASVKTDASCNEQGEPSLAASPVRFRGQSVTPGFVPTYSFQPGTANYMPDRNIGSLQYTCRDSATPSDRTPLTMESPMAPGVEKNRDFSGVPTQNECTVSQTNTGGDQYAEQRGNFPRSPVLDRPVVNQMTPRRGPVQSYAERSYIASSSLPAGRLTENGCHSFVRHLIGSGSGPYRSHPLFPLLRDLVIADMNFEAPSFPYPLIAGLPKSFDRLISNYFSCTSHAANTASIDSSVDAIVMDALRYAHSALLGNFNICCYVVCFKSCNVVVTAWQLRRWWWWYDTVQGDSDLILALIQNKGIV